MKNLIFRLEMCWYLITQYFPFVKAVNANCVKSSNNNNNLECIYKTRIRLTRCGSGIHSRDRLRPRRKRRNNSGSPRGSEMGYTGHLHRLQEHQFHPEAVELSEPKKPFSYSRFKLKKRKSKFNIYRRGARVNRFRMGKIIPRNNGRSPTVCVADRSKCSCARS